VRFGDAPAGTDLPNVDVPITATLIVAGAIASRDYQDVHHDALLARERGAKDIFMNVLTTNGLVGKYVTDWAGPDAILRSVAIRLGAPNHPGDTMRFSGHVAAVDADAATVELAIVGANSLGNHVTGRVRVTLPRGDGA
jgi:hypothetical protein